MNKRNDGRAGGRYSQIGMSLMELMVVVIIIAVLVAIAMPVYSGYVGRTRRVAAEGCMMQTANFMERFYTTKLTYVGATTSPITILDCMQTSQTGNDYSYTFSSGQPTATTYIVQATPIGVQATRDAKCGTLTIDQTGTRQVSGSDTLADCWQ
jgi:type IV pilus assembly protein PilE